MRWVLSVLITLCLCAPVYAGEIYISDQGGTHVGSCEDNFLLSGVAADKNYGAATYCGTGQNVLGLTIKTIQRFDITRIPDTATILTAEIVMYCWQVDGGGEDVHCYQIADANNDWVEGTENNNTQVGSSCWNDHTYQNTQEWAGAAGLATAGTDYINTSLANVNVTATGSKTWTLNATGITAIQNKLAANDIEFLFFSSPGGANDIVFFDSSEGATASQRPYLHITFGQASTLSVSE